MRFAGHPVAVAVHVRPVARLAIAQRRLARGAHFVAAGVMDARHDRIEPRLLFGRCPVLQRNKPADDAQIEQRPAPQLGGEGGFADLVPEQRPARERADDTANDD